jgi:hypothetical protein
MRLGGWRKSRRDDARSLANGEEVVPVVGCNNAAVVGGKASGLEIKRGKEMAWGVREWDSSGPGNNLGWVWSLNRSDELNGTKFHDIVNRVNRNTVPLGPPGAAPRMTQGLA